jgi:DNA-binding LytR/AlgR family response regulator
MNCIIVDDEPFARKGLSDLLAGFSSLELAGSFNSAAAAGEYLSANTVDLVFLDIQMSGINGLEFARLLPERTLIIFTTAYSQYALESYDVDAIDYLVKPISPERFTKAVEKATTHMALLEKGKDQIETIAENHILIRADRRFYKVAFDQITHIEGLKDYVILYTCDSKYVTWINLKNIHSRLPAATFLRVSKSYVVNHHFITSFDNNTIYFGDLQIAIGKAYQEGFFKHYVGREQS